jgi:hypothetical protein
MKRTLFCRPCRVSVVCHQRGAKGPGEGRFGWDRTCWQRDRRRGEGGGGVCEMVTGQITWQDKEVTLHG